MLFVTSQFYGLGKQLGAERAARTVVQQLEGPMIVDGAFLGSDQPLPAVRTIRKLQSLDNVSVAIECASSALAKTRSRWFWAALQSEAEVWVAIDDDCEATVDTLAYLLEAVRTSFGVCIVPCLLRRTSEGATRTNVQVLANCLDSQRELPNGGLVVPALGGGFGIVAAHRYALREIQAANQDCLWEDDDGVTRLAVFRDLMVGRKWLGEDLSFFRRVPTNVTIEALVRGVSSHAGEVLDLADVVRYARRESEDEPPPDTKPQGLGNASH